MPAEDTTTQVAPASDPADAGAAQAEQAEATQGQAAEANGETTPELDIKTEWEKTKAELAQERVARAAAEKHALDADNLVKTQAGAQSATDRRFNRIEQQIQRQGQILKAGLTNPDQIAKLETTHEEEDKVSFADFEVEQRRGIVTALQASGFTEDDVNREELSDARLIWRLGKAVGDRGTLEDAVKSAGQAIKRMQAAKAAAAPSPTPTPKPAESNGAAPRRIANIDAGAGAGAATISMTALLAKYGEDYDSLTSAQRKSAEDYMRREGLI